MPRVPEPAMVPSARCFEYPCFSIAGRDSRPRRTTDAPMMPVDAARMMPMAVTVTARPPRTFPNRLCMERIRFSAIPDRSSINPMKMNMGKATRTQLSMNLKIRLTDMPRVR